MSRVIKFRAWNDLGNGGEMVTEENSGLKSWQILERFMLVMQFTGYKDSGGAEIYEGDVIKIDLSGAICSVKFGDYLLTDALFGKNYHHDGFYVDNNGKYDSLGACVDYGCKVIGNIHQNPDLLKKVK